ncbi:MAG: serine dehydrogenase [Actinomycetota bacterium]|nr:serine dehydrogenase [Actinomycetota bacterium]
MSTDEEQDKNQSSGAGLAGAEGAEPSAEGRPRDQDQGEHLGGPEGQADGVPDEADSGLTFPPQTPLFHAHHADRYARQELIRQYEGLHDCRFVVMIDVIFPQSVTYFEELIYGADPAQDLHLLLDSPGGDGETAIRLVRAAQARCRELTVVVPNQAKSAGTILLMGAHQILMGPTSDLGPVDPQFPHPDRPGLYAAKDLIAAVDHAEEAVAANPDSYPLHASLLADVTGVMVQQARSALESTTDLVREALLSNPDRTEEEADRLAQTVKEPLIDLPRDHGAVFGATDASKVGLPITEADPDSDQWKLIWRLWTKYFALDGIVYEGRHASQIESRPSLSV